MSTDTIRLLDRLVGNVVCAALTLLRWVLDLVSPPGPRAAPRRIIFLKLIEQGATVLAYGAIRRAVEKVGRENVYFCVFDVNREILDVLDLIPKQNVLTVRRDRLSSFLQDALSVVRRVRAADIDTTIDMEFYARATAILAFLMGARRRVGLHRFTSEAPYRGDLLTDRVQYNPYLHTAENYALLVDVLDAPAGQVPLAKLPAADIVAPAPRFEAQDEARAAVEAIVRKALGGDRSGSDSSSGQLSGPIVLFSPNVGQLLPLRQWDPARFVELGKRLLAAYPHVTILLTGAPSEREQTERVGAAIGSERVATLAGRTTLREVLVLYTLADVLVTNDSGPGHFASMTDIDNIVLFGPETPRLFGPRGGRSHVIWAELACSPCVNVMNHRFSPCTDPICMTAISVDQVYDEVCACLKARNVKASSQPDALSARAASGAE